MGEQQLCKLKVVGSTPVNSTKCSVNSTGRVPALQAGSERLLEVRVLYRVPIQVCSVMVAQTVPARLVRVRVLAFLPHYIAERISIHVGLISQPPRGRHPPLHPICGSWCSDSTTVCGTVSLGLTPNVPPKMRHWCNGSTSALQAFSRVSNTLCRSKYRSIFQW